MEEDFSHFFDPVVLRKGESGILLNDHYHLKFTHEGNFFQEGIMERFKFKQERRIERFRQLRSYQGTVFFFRFSSSLSVGDPHRSYPTPANLEISDEYALRH